MKIEDQMVECFRKCGAFVPIGGPAMCGACSVGPEPRDPRLRFTEKKRGPYLVQTIGYSVLLQCGAPDHRMFSGDARELAKALNEAADFVDGLKSPYTNKVPT